MRKRPLQAGLFLLCLMAGFWSCRGTGDSKASPSFDELAERLVKKAETHLEEGRIKEARQFAEKALDENPVCLKAVLVLSRCLLQEGSPEEAFALLLQEPAEPAWRVPCLFEAAKLAREMNQPSLAVTYLDQAIELDPDQPGLYQAKGEAEAACGRELSAEASFTQALDMGGRKEEIIPSLARVLYKLKRFEEAESLMEGSLPVEAAGHEEKILLGCIKCRLKKLEAGLRLFQEAAALNERSAGAWFNQGLALEELNREAEATAAYTKALAADPAYGPAAFHLGCLLFDQGEKEKGLGLMDQAIALEEDPAVKQALEKAREERTRPEGVQPGG